MQENGLSCISYESMFWDGKTAVCVSASTQQTYFLDSTIDFRFPEWFLYFLFAKTIDFGCCKVENHYLRKLKLSPLTAHPITEKTSHFDDRQVVMQCQWLSWSSTAGELCCNYSQWSNNDKYWCSCSHWHLGSDDTALLAIVIVTAYNGWLVCVCLQSTTLYTTASLLPTIGDTSIGARGRGPRVAGPGVPGCCQVPACSVRHAYT